VRTESSPSHWPFLPEPLRNHDGSVSRPARPRGSTDGFKRNCLPWCLWEWQRPASWPSVDSVRPPISSPMGIGEGPARRPTMHRRAYEASSLQGRHGSQSDAIALSLPATKLRLPNRSCGSVNPQWSLHCADFSRSSRSGIVGQSRMFTAPITCDRTGVQSVNVVSPGLRFATGTRIGRPATCTDAPSIFRYARPTIVEQSSA
jgi:hypothetical protein